MPGWIKDRDHENADEILLTEEELKKLPCDTVNIGSHCISHPKLTLLEMEQAKTELLESKKRLEAILGKDITLLSFPFNDYNEQIIKIARQAGYLRVFSNVPTYPISNVDCFLLGRVEVSPDDWDIEYSLKVKGAYQWLPFAITAKRKLKSLLSNNRLKYTFK